MYWVGTARRQADKGAELRVTRRAAKTLMHHAMASRTLRVMAQAVSEGVVTVARRQWWGPVGLCF